MTIKPKRKTKPKTKAAPPPPLKAGLKERKNRALPVPEGEIDRVGMLAPAEFAEMMHEALGGRGWQGVFARGTGLSPSTITRYLQGVFPIPKYVALIVHMLAITRRAGLPLPDGFGFVEVGPEFVC